MWPGEVGLGSAGPGPISVLRLVCDVRPATNPSRHSPARPKTPSREYGRTASPSRNYYLGEMLVRGCSHSVQYERQWRAVRHVVAGMFVGSDVRATG